MRAIIFLYIDYDTDQGRGQYNGQGVYCGSSAASEVFLFFTIKRDLRPFRDCSE